MPLSIHWPRASGARASGGATVLVGMLHVALTACIYRDLSVDALWFAGSGIAVMLIGALTILAEYARPVRWTALAANGAGIGLGVAFTVLTRSTEPQGPVLVALFLAAILSLTLSRGNRHAARRPPPDLR